jgi:hypothetical protein
MAKDNDALSIDFQDSQTSSSHNSAVTNDTRSIRDSKRKQRKRLDDELQDDSSENESRRNVTVYDAVAGLLFYHLLSKKDSNRAQRESA